VAIWRTAVETFSVKASLCLKICRVELVAAELDCINNHKKLESDDKVDEKA
jgi:hypothetical protein